MVDEVLGQIILSGIGISIQTSFHLVPANKPCPTYGYQPFPFVVALAYLFQADDSLLCVSVCGYGVHIGALRVDDAILNVRINTKVFIVGFDLSHWFPNLSGFWDIQLVIFCE